MQEVQCWDMEKKQAFCFSSWRLKTVFKISVFIARQHAYTRLNCINLI